MAPRQLITAILLLAAMTTASCHALSIEAPPDESKPVKRNRADRYLASAERLKAEADKLEKRIAKLPVEQQKAAEDLVAAKRDLAVAKTEAAELWKKHLGEIPESFKPKLREKQTAHSKVLKEFYRIGREIKEAKKAASTSTNLFAPASVFGK